MLRMPIAHGEGSLLAARRRLDALEAARGVVFRYAQPEGNPNGSSDDIAGVLNAAGNVCGLMPHPERAAEALLGSDDGLLLMRSLVESMAAGEVGRVIVRRRRSTAAWASPTPSSTRSTTRLGREPNELELAMFSVMWSEHCSYKSSKRLLRDAADAQATGVLAGPGENAGVVAIGDGLAVAFKIESHNHPSAVEPYQGAATGVGGILRDIVAMGARPVALLDALKFGWPDDQPHTPAGRWRRAAAWAATATASASPPLAAS